MGRAIATSKSSGPAAQRRGSVEIIGDILKLAEGGERKTRIMYGANLSYDLLTKYLSYCEAKGFVAKEGPTEEYRITPLGRKLLQCIQEVHALLGAEPPKGDLSPMDPVRTHP